MLLSVEHISEQRAFPLREAAAPREDPGETRRAPIGSVKTDLFQVGLAALVRGHALGLRFRIRRH